MDYYGYHSSFLIFHLPPAWLCHFASREQPCLSMVPSPWLIHPPVSSLCCPQRHLCSCLPSFIHGTFLFSPTLAEPWTITASTECSSIESGHPCRPYWSLTPDRPPPIAMCTCLLLQAAIQTWLVSSRKITDLLRIWTMLFFLLPFPQQNVGCCVNIRCC